MRKKLKQKNFRIIRKTFASKSKLKKFGKNFKKNIFKREKRKIDEKNFETEKFENNWKNFEENFYIQI